MVYMETIVNKVAQSGIITLDLQELILDNKAIEKIDLKDYLFQELLLREKDFRASMLAIDWSIYQDKYVAIYCSSEAIIPMWAYMLIGSYLSDVATDYYFGTPDQLKDVTLTKRITELDTTRFIDARVVVKGCGDNSVSENGFLKISQFLKPLVKSLMYGEPCSTVPIYKKK